VVKKIELVDEKDVSEENVCGWRRWVWMKEMIVSKGNTCELRRWMWRYLYR